MLTILSELIKKSGRLNVTGRISVATQSPWIFSGTIRENILMGSDFNPDKYDQVIKAICLDKDLQFMPYGDLTFLSESSTGLSGGQCSRISLARCIYSEADIYIFDEPFSALDATVSRKIFQECVQKYLSKKLRIILSNQKAMAKHADHVILLDKVKSVIS